MSALRATRERTAGGQCAGRRVSGLQGWYRVCRALPAGGGSGSVWAGEVACNAKAFPAEACDLDAHPAVFRLFQAGPKAWGGMGCQEK